MVCDAQSGQELTAIGGLRQRNPMAGCCFAAFSPDGKRLAGTSEGNTL
jgi:hypothetical protein